MGMASCPDVYPFLLSALLQAVERLVSAGLYRAFTAGDAPPQIQIGVEAITQTPNGYLVEILVSNSGEQTASTLQVEGRLMQGSEAV
jgi:uncharacterized protein (TIGR02588 family)